VAPKGSHGLVCTSLWTSSFEVVPYEVDTCNKFQPMRDPRFSDSAGEKMRSASTRICIILSTETPTPVHMTCVSW